MLGGTRLAGKVALITGAGAGIGRKTALLFARQGVKGVVCVDKNEEAVQQTVALVEQARSSSQRCSTALAMAVQADVSKLEDCERMVKLTEQQFGQLNVLFNNAGIMLPQDGDALSTSEEIWDTVMAVNVKGVFFGCKCGIPALKRAGGGSIINTGSFVGFVGAATPQLAYTSSKGAVLSMTRELAVIHARQNIRVNAVCPGPLNTELLQKFLDTRVKQDRRLVHVPMGRFGEASEVANAALFLASDESSFVTGTCLMVDGGITAAYVTSDEQVDPFGGPKGFA